MEVVIDTSLADGEWHSVKVTKKKQRLSVLVDEVHKKGSKISKVLKVDAPLFVGGVPIKFIPLLNDEVVSRN